MVGDTDTAVYYDVFRVGVHGGRCLSEDYWVAAGSGRSDSTC